MVAWDYVIHVVAVESSCVTRVCVLRLQYGQSINAGPSSSRSSGVTNSGLSAGTMAGAPTDEGP